MTDRTRTFGFFQTKLELELKSSFFFIAGPKVSRLNANQYTMEYVARPNNRICNPPVGSTSKFDRRSSGSDDEDPTSAELVSSLFVT